MIAGAVAMIAGCYQPAPPQGLPCTSELRCPAGQRCVLDAADGPRCNGLSVEEEPPHPTNDGPAAAVDVSAGGTFAIELAGATDDTGSSCAPGRPDVFYRFALTKAETIYLDTFDSPFDTAVTLRAGACPAAGEERACVEDSCGRAQSQGAWNLAAGEYCIVVDGPAASPDPGADSAGKLSVVRGKYTGDPLPAATSGSVRGDTCTDDNSNSAGCGCEPAEDHHYFFTVCPGVMTATRFETCGTMATWDTVLQLRSAGGDGLACDDDTCDGTSSAINRTVMGPALFWAIIDGCTECGEYTMKYTLTPRP